MNLADFKFIPQKNKQKGTISLDDFLQVVIEPVINYSIKRSIKDQTIYFKKANFLFEDGWGYTLALDSKNKLFLFRTEKNNENPLMEPKFLIDAKATPFTKSNYVDYAFQTAYPDVTLFQTKIVQDNQWEIIPAVADVTSTAEVQAVTTVPVADLSAAIIDGLDLSTPESKDIFSNSNISNYIN